MSKYKALDYTAEVTPMDQDGENYFVASTGEFGRSVCGYGETPALAIEDLYETLADVLTDLECAGEQLPTPRKPYMQLEFSGKVTVRMSPVLHSDIHWLSQCERMSLNQTINSLLTEGVERRKALAGNRGVFGNYMMLKEIQDGKCDNSIVPVLQNDAVRAMVVHSGFLKK